MKQTWLLATDHLNCPLDGIALVYWNLGYNRQVPLIDLCLLLHQWVQITDFKISGSYQQYIAKYFANPYICKSWQTFQNNMIMHVKVIFRFCSPIINDPVH